MRHRRPPDCDRPVADRRPPFARSPASEAAHTGALRSAGSRHARYGRVRLVVPPANEAAPAAVRPFDRWATGQTGRLRSVAGERRPSLWLRVETTYFARTARYDESADGRLAGRSDAACRQWPPPSVHEMHHAQARSRASSERNVLGEPRLSSPANGYFHRRARFTALFGRSPSMGRVIFWDYMMA